MTVYRFTPPKHRSVGGNPIAGLLHFLKDPVGEIIELGLASRSAHADPTSRQVDMLPFAVDDEYDSLNFEIPQPRATQGRIALLDQGRADLANKALPYLQQVYATGQLVPGIPKPYQAAARDVAAIGAAKLARGPAPVQPPEQITLPRTDTGQNFMGGFIPPGGMAGFSQMTPASQLSLTRGARGTRRAGKRRKSSKSRKVKRTKRTKTRKRGKAKRFVKGSAAAKRYMAKIRRKRK